MKSVRCGFWNTGDHAGERRAHAEPNIDTAGREMKWSGRMGVTWMAATITRLAAAASVNRIPIAAILDETKNHAVTCTLA